MLLIGNVTLPNRPGESQSGKNRNFRIGAGLRRYEVDFDYHIRTTLFRNVAIRTD
jgi:hypothetical protein